MRENLERMEVEAESMADMLLALQAEKQKEWDKIDRELTHLKHRATFACKLLGAVRDVRAALEATEDKP